MILTKIRKKISYLRAKYFLNKENFLHILDLSKKNNKTTGVELTDHYILASYIKENKIDKAKAILSEINNPKSYFSAAIYLEKMNSFIFSSIDLLEGLVFHLDYKI